MKFLKNLFLLMLFSVVLFGAGYLVGRQQPEKMENLVEQGRGEISGKAKNLEKEVLRLRHRMRQFNISRRLASAQAALAEKNYGIVESELQKAQKEVAALKNLSPPDRQKILSKLESSLDGLIESADNMNPKLKSRLGDLREAFERMYED